MPHVLVLLILALAPLRMALTDDCPANLDFRMRPLASDRAESLCERYAGKVLLVVNTASQCGFTPQYQGLDALYDRYRKQGLVVLGFPSNDFAQEPGGEKDIQNFCRLNYGVRFPMYEKIGVSSAAAHPFYHQLAAGGDGYPQWNFYKYLLDRNGVVVALFPSRTRPDDPQLIAAIEQLL
ncbi:MAG: glutathione peroxidase [Candidatus Competibacteraceae bacterium]|nr:MAG: glutathione peroxidase [Candidatus Competibacteraceae bacterium]